MEAGPAGGSAVTAAHPIAVLVPKGAATATEFPRRVRPAMPVLHAAPVGPVPGGPGTRPMAPRHPPPIATEFATVPSETGSVPVEVMAIGTNLGPGGRTRCERLIRSLRTGNSGPRRGGKQNDGGNQQ